MTESAAAPQAEGRLLCNRKKDVNVYLLPDNRHYRVHAEMQDGVHHMRITMTVSEPALIITEIETEMPGVPDSLCREGRGCLGDMVGRRIAPGLTRGMNHSAGGCTHLINLFHEACYNITLAQAVNGKETLTKAFPGISDAELYHIFLWFKPEIENSCVRYRSESPFMQAVKTAEAPHGAASLKTLARQLNEARAGDDGKAANS